MKFLRCLDKDLWRKINVRETHHELRLVWIKNLVGEKEKERKKLEDPTVRTVGSTFSLTKSLIQTQPKKRYY